MSVAVDCAGATVELAEVGADVGLLLLVDGGGEAVELLGEVEEAEADALVVPSPSESPTVPSSSSSVVGITCDPSCDVPPCAVLFKGIRHVSQETVLACQAVVGEYVMNKSVSSIVTFVWAQASSDPKRRARNMRVNR